MTIDPDVARIAKQMGSDPALIQAVMQAEGGTKARLLKAVQCSTPSITTTDKAIEVTCRSANHALAAYISAHDAPGFVAFWASRWAPQGAENDPTDLNKNWPLNVLSRWKRILAVLVLLLTVGCASLPTTPSGTLSAWLALQVHERSGTYPGDWDVYGASHAAALARLETWAIRKGVVIASAPIESKQLLGITQYWNATGWVVLINRDLSPDGQLATLLHELAHVYGPHGLTVEDAEVVAELTSAQVCERLHLDVWPQTTAYLMAHARPEAQASVAFRYATQIDALVTMLTTAAQPLSGESEHPKFELAAQRALVERPRGSASGSEGEHRSPPAAR